MAVEHFIEGKHDNAHHAGRHSTMMRLQSAMESMREWRQERTVAHETGHTPEPFDPHFHPDQYRGGESEEIVLFFREAKTQRDCE